MVLDTISGSPHIKREGTRYGAIKEKSEWNVFHRAIMPSLKQSAFACCRKDATTHAVLHPRWSTTKPEETHLFSHLCRAREFFLKADAFHSPTEPQATRATTEAADWEAFARELDDWTRSGRRATFWWRP